jgi:hypothetical protein
MRTAELGAAGEKFVSEIDPRRWRGWVGSYHIAKIAVLAFLTACAELPEIPASGCGNSVVEPSEDCDTIALDGLTCAPADQANACRYVCDPDAPACPGGWGCGADGVCRVPSGVLEEPVASRFSAVSLAIGDVDGDGAGDLVGLLPNRASVHYGADASETSFSFGLASGDLSVHDLDRDGFDDVIVPTFLGLFVARGASAPPLAPVTFAPLSIPADTHVRFAPLDADVGSYAYPGEEILAVFDGTVFFFAEDAPLSTIALLPEKPGGGRFGAQDLVGRIPTFDPGPEPAGFALAFGGATTVYAYLLEPVTLPGGAVRPRPFLKTTVALPAGWVVAAEGARFVDYNGVAGPDLLIAVQPETGTGRKRAVIAVDHPDLSASSFAERFRAITEPSSLGLTCGDSEVPLALAYDGNDYIVVASNAICALDLGCPADVPCFDDYWAKPIALNTSGVPWTEGLITDLNGDGRVDVVATSGVFSFLDVFIAGPLTHQFNPFYVATLDPPTSLRSGDFDGDFIEDLAVIERGDLTGRGSALSILYGKTQGAPEAPVSIGSFSPVVSLEPAHIVKNPVFQNDSVRDLFVQFDGPEEKGLAVLFGTSQRTLLSPYTLISPEGGGEEIPLAAVTAELDGDGIPDLFAASADHGWFLRGTAGGDLETVDAPPLTVSGQNRIRCTKWVAGHFVSQERQSIIGLDRTTAGRFCSPEVSDIGDPSLLFARVVEGELQATSIPLPTDLGLPVTLQGADLDGDGLDELVIAFQRQDLPLRVFWNGGSGPEGGEATIAPPFPGSCEGCKGMPLSLSIGNMDEDAELEIAVLGDTGVWVLEADPGTHALTWHEKPVLAALSEPFSDGDVRLVDLDGDGVRDVAVSQGTVIVSRRSVPLR